MKPKCIKCSKRFDEYGAVLLSPPTEAPSDLEQDVTKYHMCLKCWHRLLWEYFL